MEDFFIFIGIIAIGVVVLCLIYVGLQEKDDKKKENEELFQYVGDEDEFDNKLSRAENIEKKLSEPGVRQKAEEIRKQALRNRAKNEDNWRKEQILKRTYSYQYEDVVYEIFSPLATKSSICKGQTWAIQGGIDADFFRGEVLRILNVSPNEAYRLTDEFAQNDLIKIMTPPDSWREHCYIGELLYYRWDVISKYDKNFSTWMEAHPNVEKRDNYIQREKEFIKEVRIWQLET